MMSAGMQRTLRSQREREAVAGLSAHELNELGLSRDQLRGHVAMVRDATRQADAIDQMVSLSAAGLQRHRSV